MRYATAILSCAAILALTGCGVGDAEKALASPEAVEEGSESPSKTGVPWGDAGSSDGTAPGDPIVLPAPVGPLVNDLADQYEPINNEATKLVMKTQEYNGKNVVEIPVIVYDKTNPQLQKENGENFDINAVNRIVEKNAIEAYDKFMASHDPETEWIEIKTYPFTTKDHIQFVMTMAQYPSSESGVEIFSGNFEVYYNRIVTIDDLFTKLGVARESLEETVRSLLLADQDGARVDSLEFPGFLLAQGPDKKWTKLFVEILMSNPGSQNRRAYYQYIPETNELSELDPSHPFDVSELDAMDPPLLYARPQN
jgi:hypothetical protein